MQDPSYGSKLADRAQRTENLDEEHQEAATAIYDVTDACSNTLESLSAVADANSSSDAFMGSYSASSDEPPRDIRDIRNSFAFWIDYTGALAPIGASLDDRLGEYEVEWQANHGLERCLSGDAWEP